MGFLIKRYSAPEPERPAPKTRTCPGCRGLGHIHCIKRPEDFPFGAKVPDRTYFTADCPRCHGSGEVPA